MKGLSFILGMLLLALSVQAQNADSPHEGLRAVLLVATPGNVGVRWWGKAGRTYFVQTSETLELGSWTFLPIVETGVDSIMGIALPAPVDKLFVRLVYTDQSVSGSSAGAEDFDGDGLTNAQEVSETIRTDPFSSDSDGDGTSDGTEYNDGGDPLAASNGDGYETDEVEFPFMLMGHHKSVNNSWYGGPAPQQCHVSWYGSAPSSSGSEFYTGFSPRYESKLDSLLFPPSSYGGGDFGSPYYVFGSQAVARSEHFLSTTNYVGRASAYQILLRIGTSPQSGPATIPRQPWAVSHDYLAFATSRPSQLNSSNSSPAAFAAVRMQQLTIPKGSFHTDEEQALVMTPPVSLDTTLHDVVTAPAIYSLTSFGVDKLSNHGLPEIPVRVPLVGGHPSTAGLPDHWVMLKRNVPTTFRLEGTMPVNTNYRMAYQLNGSSVTASGGTVEPGGLIRTDQHAFNYVTLTGISPGDEIKEDGVIYAGAADGANGTPYLAYNRPLARCIVLPPVNLTVVVHPIALTDDSGNVRAAPQDLATQTALKSYLDSIFLTQANVTTQVTILPTTYVNWDVGLGQGVQVPGNYAGNGEFEILDTNSQMPAQYSQSAEETKILDWSPPLQGVDVNVYYIASPEYSIHHGSPRMLNPVVKWNTVLGYAGKARSGQSSGVLYVLDAPASVEAKTPSSSYIIAHEIVHYVAKVGHTTYNGETNERNWTPNGNQAPNTDNQIRLMTGRIGPKRQLGPKTMVKFEWRRLNLKTGISGKE